MSLSKTATSSIKKLPSTIAKKSNSTKFFLLFGPRCKDDIFPLRVNDKNNYNREITGCYAMIVVEKNYNNRESQV